MSTESLLLADRNYIYQHPVGVRHAAEVRLRQMVDKVEAALHFDTLSLAVSSKVSKPFLNFQHPNDDGLLFYARFPYLFYELYSQVPLEQYDQLALSQQLYLNYGVMIDRLMDGKLLMEPQIAYWTNSIYQEIILILSGLFSINSPFWAYFEKCHIEHTQTLILERIKHTYRVSEYSDQEILLVFSGKSGMAKAGLAALAYLSQQEISKDAILSCEAFHIGFQFMDDVQDWRNDYRDHVYTPLLTRVLFDHHLNDKVESVQRPDVNSIGSLVYGCGYAQAALEKAIEYFNLALYAIKDANCPAWQSEIQGMIARCKGNQAYLDQKLRQMKEKRNLQTIAVKAQAEPQSALQDISMFNLSSSQQLPDAWVEAFCQSTGLAIKMFREGSQPVSDSADELESLWVEGAREVLKRCESFAPPPSGLQLWLCNVPQIPASLCFEHEQRWQIVLNRAAFPGNADDQLRACQEHLAYQYGCMSRLNHSSNPESFLDEICVKGFGMVFVTKILPDLEQSVHLPNRMDWFERNKHYLWQEVQPYLGLPASFDLNAAMNFDKVDAFLSYDLIASYCERMGNEALCQGVRSSTEHILDKSTVLAIANRIAGAKQCAV
jgi:hypothetical protein